MRKYIFENDGTTFYVKTVGEKPWAVAMSFDDPSLYMPFEFLRTDLQEKFSAAIRDGTAKLQDS